jgi:hypothetical protein
MGFLVKTTDALRFRSFIPFTTLLVFFGSGRIFSHGPPAARSRAEFARAMARIKEKTPQDKVLAVLGQPDDIRAQFDPGGIWGRAIKEVWCYGTKGHLSFPTLGCVFIDTNGLAQEIVGARGQPPRSGLFKEDELQDLLRLLNTAPALEGDTFNPLPLIQIVNTLQPLGKEKALAAIGEYLRVSMPWRDFSGPRSGLFLVMRVLFDVPGGMDSCPKGLIGYIQSPPQRNPHLTPCFPIALADDIPMLLSGFGALEFFFNLLDPSPVENDVKFYREHGHFRSQPLGPSNDPLAALTHLMKSQQWIYADSKLAQSGGVSFGDAQNNEEEKSMLREQLLRLIDSVYRLPTDYFGNRLPEGPSLEPSWQKIVADVSALKIKWDPQQNMFVFQDGSQLSKLTRKIYQREIWRLTGMGFEDAELIIERKSDEWVDVMLTRVEKTGAKLRPSTLILFAGDENQPPLLTFKYTNNLAIGGGSWETRTVRLGANTELRARLEIAGYRTNTSFVFKP